MIEGDKKRIGIRNPPVTRCIRNFNRLWPPNVVSASALFRVESHARGRYLIASCGAHRLFPGDAGFEISQGDSQIAISFGCRPRLCSPHWKSSRGRVCDLELGHRLPRLPVTSQFKKTQTYCLSAAGKGRQGPTLKCPMMNSVREAAGGPSSTSIKGIALLIENDDPGRAG